MGDVSSKINTCSVDVLIKTSKGCIRTKEEENVRLKDQV